MNRATALAKQYPNAAVPLHLRNAPTKLMADIGYGKDYKWETDFIPDKDFLPDELNDKTIL
jgi:putative ATPase